MTADFGSTIDEYVQKDRKSKYRKTEFMNLEAGEHRLRILEPMETKKYTHYIGFAYIECLGDDCPVCENNKRILYEHPEDYKQVKGWSPRSQRFYINVLDKTPAKGCPKCGLEKVNYAGELCPEDGVALQTLAPRVKVLSMGSMLLEDIKVLSKSVRNKQDERIDIRMYDFILDIKGAKTSKVTNVAHKWYPGDEALEDLGEQELFDLSEVAVKLSREEMLDVFNGAKLKDIFVMRKAKRQIAESDFLSPEDTQAVNEGVDKLFKA
jgi:hypothetical protein